MTTFINFAPSATATPPFQAQVTLDGEVYSLQATSNLFGNRWYFDLFAGDGTLVGTRALVGSPSGFNLQSLSWAAGVVTATAVAPHGYKLGRIVTLTISGATPDAFNGQVQATITGPTTFEYALAADPGAATVFGSAAYNIDLIGGLFDVAGNAFSSTLVYRTQARQFEVSP